MAYLFLKPNLIYALICVVTNKLLRCQAQLELTLMMCMGDRSTFTSVGALSDRSTFTFVGALSDRSTFTSAGALNDCFTFTSTGALSG